MSIQAEDNINKKNDDLIKVVVACHYPLLREGISNILADDENIQVVSKVSNLLDLVQSCEEFELDVLLLDVDLQGLNLTKILQLLKKNKGAKVILITNGNYNENTLINAIRSGVRSVWSSQNFYVQVFRRFLPGLRHSSAYNLLPSGEGHGSGNPQCQLV